MAAYPLTTARGAFCGWWLSYSFDTASDWDWGPEIIKNIRNQLTDKKFWCQLLRDPTFNLYLPNCHTQIREYTSILTYNTIWKSKWSFKHVYIGKVFMGGVWILNTDTNRDDLWLWDDHNIFAYHFNFQSYEQKAQSYVSNMLH